MNEIQQRFKGRKAFITFITCGDPDLVATERYILTMARNGVDIVELGIPFSDPMAEGPVIQSANERALRSGTTTDDVFALARRLRAASDLTLVIMTYANVVFSYGIERFLSAASAAGISGLILPDVPYEERGDFSAACDAAGVSLIPLIAPTSAARIAKIAATAQGFIYLVSSLGVTGVRDEIKTDLETIVTEIRRTTDLPVAIGFGISNPEQAAKMAKTADGVIIGSAIIRMIEQYGDDRDDADAAIARFVRDVRDALDRV